MASKIQVELTAMQAAQIAICVVAMALDGFMPVEDSREITDALQAAMREVEA